MIGETEQMDATTFEKWLSNLSGEQRCDFNSDGRGYPKSRDAMMRLAWDAAILTDREARAVPKPPAGEGWRQ